MLKTNSLLLCIDSNSYDLKRLTRLINASLATEETGHKLN